MFNGVRCRSWHNTPCTDKRLALRALARAISMRDAAPFLDPVDLEVAPAYYFAVAYPICLTQIRERVNSDFYRRIEVPRHLPFA